MSAAIPIITNISDIRRAVADAKAAGKRVGFVPTMGALHAGHARLIEVAKAECGYLVVSIFVNPTQFGPKEDFDKYPRTMEADRELSAGAGADAVFAPERADVYPPGHCTFVEVEGLQDVLCGASRPGHFRGVCTVVAKLFHMVPADVAYFGQKDAQQLLIVQRMVRDLNINIAIRSVPTIREPDGLAMSSRNRYLSPEDRAEAPTLFRALETARRRIAGGERDAAAIERSLIDELSRVPGLRVDYARVVAADTLESPANIKGPTLIALAAYFGSTRLIDNILVEVT